MVKFNRIAMKWLVFISLIWSIKAENQCYADIKFPYNYFSSKTSYEASRAPFMKTPDHCTPKYMWALIRHGTRFNSAKEITRMRDLTKLRDQIVLNRKEGRGELCEKDLKNIKHWKFFLTESLNSGLTSQGKLDQIFLAKRLKTKFPTLLSSSSRDDFIIETSEIQRAKDSAVSFTNELFDTKFTNVNGNRLIENQQLLHLKKNCLKYEKEVLSNRATYKEFFAFLESKEVKQVLDEVSKRLGFTYTLPFRDVDLMYESCAYENAWYLNSKPPFCAAFTEHNLKAFEYLRDLDNYWEQGYGHPMNEKLGCNLVRDMMMTLSNASHTDHPEYKATLYFSHSEMIIPTTIKLGLNRDSDPLRHDNYDIMKDDRKWKLAFVDSFASNIIAVLFKCPGHKINENQVVVYRSEHEVILPGCSESPCSLKLLQQYYEDVFDINKCNSDFCQITSSAISNSRESAISFGWIIILYLIISKYCCDIFYFI